MRFFISRILKNVPFLFKKWNILLEGFDRHYYRKISGKYIIIPFGTYCLPRVIVALGRLKPKKFYGEKTCPFDLLFSDLYGNVNLLKAGFEDFFDDIIFDKNKNYYINKKYNIEFFHDGNLTYEEFRVRYSNRIRNLLEYLNDKRHVYFLIATFEVPETFCLKDLAETVKKYRKNDSFDIIVINQSKTKVETEISNVHMIDLTSDMKFERINREGNWVQELKYMKTLAARRFYNKLLRELKKIIK